MIARTEMLHPVADWRRVTPNDPCRVCGHDSWCTVDANDGTVRCKREQSDRPAHGADGDAWLHSPDGSEPLPPPPTEQEKPGRDWRAEADRFAEDITDEQIEGHAASLGVSTASLRDLGTGWSGHSFSTPMYAADGSVCGIRLRPLVGKKHCVTGSKLGVFRSRKPGSGPLWICEGESDCAAALTLEWDAIGVPGTGQVPEIVAAYGKNRDCIICADNDEPGRIGAEKQAKALLPVARTLRIIRPPKPHKDLRDWLRAGCTRADIAAAIEAAPFEQVQVEVSEPVVIAPTTTAPWPDPMGPAIRIGVIGPFLDAVELQTEADSAAMVVDLLTRMGSAVHRGPHFMVSGDRHGCNLFNLIVGPTAQGRKGSSAAFPRAIMQRADALWSEQCCKSGLSSGEGVVWAVRDPTEVGTDRKTGEPIMDSGVIDKRLFVMESEFARTLKAAGRRENTLATLLRQAWEGGQLASMTKAPYSATGAHVSLIAHVTKTEFRSLLSDGDVAGGTMNRFLFIASRRQRELPFGGSVPDLVLDQLGEQMAACIETARKHASEMHFSDEARAQWVEIYHDLQRDEGAPGITGQLLGRATAQTRRLAMLFAIADRSVVVDVPHLRAACEVWRYSRQTVHYLFGTATGNRVADRIIGELRGTAALPRSEMYKLFDRHVTADEIDEALLLIQTMGIGKGERIATAGRPREVWRATR